MELEDDDFDSTPPPPYSVAVAQEEHSRATIDTTPLTTSDEIGDGSNFPRRSTAPPEHDYDYPASE